jgi:hypothetical protein
MTSSRWRAFVASAVLLAAIAPAPASGESLRGLAASLLPPLERAEQAARSGDPDAMQARYDAARTIVEALRRRLSSDCGSALSSLSAYARANVAAAEAFDRNADRTRVEARARATSREARRALSRCAVGRLEPKRGTIGQVPAVPLPPSAALPVPATTRDRRLDARLAAVARGFKGYSAVVVHDLASGRRGSWNADARFPAASTVKLGVLVASLRAAGAYPERSARWYDLEQLTGWSSNLAANKLYGMLGRSAVETTLRRLGARTSTYPGVYRVGTAHGAAPPTQPPVVSRRVTTAGDLAAVLTTIHKAAFGDLSALRGSGLTRHQARLALGLLLASRPVGDNVGLFHAALPAAMPVAQKNGWLSDAFHTAAILYTPSGPVVCVLLTYRDGISRAEATRLGARVVRVGLLP